MKMNLPETTQTNSAQFTQFLVVKLHLCFYKTSPTAYYSSVNASLFPSSSTYMKQSQFYELSKTLKIHLVTQTSQMSSVFAYDDDLGSIQTDIRELCSSIGCVKKSSILTIDDDHLQLQSRAVETAEFNNFFILTKTTGGLLHGVFS